MNDSELENELRALRPAAPSTALESRITDELATLSASAAQRLEPVRKGLLAHILRPLFWASAGAAAAVAVMTFKTPPPNAASPQLAAAQLYAVGDAFSSPETTRELLDAEQGEVRFETDRGPVRIIRASYLEHHAWINPRTGGHLEIAVPREDIFLQPIPMQ